MKTYRICTLASLMLLSFGLFAQPQNGGERPAPPKKKTPEEIAKKEADMMKAEVGLTDKQYKKVYKLIKKDWQYRQSQAENSFGGGMPPQGGPGGMGGPGGGMGGDMMGGPGGMGGGGMMGGPGGMGGGGMMGGPGGGMPQGGMENGQRPEGGPGMGGPGMDVVTDEYLEKQDAKLKKILTEEQYVKWRSKHPAEHMALPPMEMEAAISPGA